MTIAVTSGKGGVGKSSLALNLAALWSSRGRRVLVFDADLALGNIHVLLGLSPILTLTDFLTGRAPLEKILVRAPRPSTNEEAPPEHAPPAEAPMARRLVVGRGFDILPAGSGHLEAVDISPEQRDMLIDRIYGLVSDYDIVLVDTAPGLTGNVLAFASACDETLIVTTPEPTALSDAYALMKLLFRASGHAHVRIAMNMASDRATGRTAAEGLHAAARRFLEREVASVGEVCFDPLVAAAVRRREPFVTLYPRCRASKDLCAIAERLYSAQGSPRPEAGVFRERLSNIVFGRPHHSSAR